MSESAKEVSLGGMSIYPALDVGLSNSSHNTYSITEAAPSHVNMNVDSNGLDKNMKAFRASLSLSNKDLATLISDKPNSPSVQRIESEMVAVSLPKNQAMHDGKVVRFEGEHDYAVKVGNEYQPEGSEFKTNWGILKGGM